MVEHELVINYASMKPSIEGNYLLCLDNMYRCLTVALGIKTIESIDVDTVFIENAYYAGLLRDVKAAQLGGRNPLELLGESSNAFLYLDMSLYLDNWILKNHSDSKTNVYSVTIDHKYNVVIKLKQFGRRHVVST